uniref:F-box protein n=1 Tax=Mesocestoides corti TaxID=53468 RepID=A0A5K3EQ53_MESCO
MGDYRRIVFPKDSRGRICGLDYPEKGSLFFFDMLSCLDIGDLVLEYGCPTEQVCVSRCPNYTWTAAEGDTFESRSKMICQGGVSGNHDPYKKK